MNGTAAAHACCRLSSSPRLRACCMVLLRYHRPAPRCRRLGSARGGGPSGQRADDMNSTRREWQPQRAPKACSFAGLAMTLELSLSPRTYSNTTTICVHYDRYKMPLGPEGSHWLPLHITDQRGCWALAARTIIKSVACYQALTLQGDRSRATARALQQKLALDRATLLIDR